MKKFHLSSIVLVGSMVALSSAPAALGAEAWGRQHESSATFSFAHDLELLKDQFDLELVFGASKFLVATRPGQNLYVSRLVAPDQVLHQALVLMPGPEDRVPPRSEVLANREHLESHAAVLCLNATTARPKNFELITQDDCQPRPINDEDRDLVMRLTKAEELEMRVASDHKIAGADVKLLAYRTSGYKSFADFNPLEKCCLQQGNVEVCGCRVEIKGAKEPVSCNAGCAAPDR